MRPMLIIIIIPILYGILVVKRRDTNAIYCGFCCHRLQYSGFLPELSVCPILSRCLHVAWHLLSSLMFHRLLVWLPKKHCLFPVKLYILVYVFSHASLPEVSKSLISEEKQIAGHHTWATKPLNGPISRTAHSLALQMAAPQRQGAQVRILVDPATLPAVETAFYQSKHNPGCNMARRMGRRFTADGPFKLPNLDRKLETAL